MRSATRSSATRSTVASTGMCPAICAPCPARSPFFARSPTGFQTSGRRPPPGVHERAARRSPRVLDALRQQLRKPRVVKNPQILNPQISMLVYKSRVFQVEETRVRFPDGRERDIAVVRHAPVVVLIPVPALGQVILIRQYRASIARDTWELPGGRHRAWRDRTSGGAPRVRRGNHARPSRSGTARGMVPESRLLRQTR